MKKLVILLASFILSSGVVMATPTESDCDDDDVEPVSTSMSKR